jgi:hypothetical protein
MERARGWKKPEHILWKDDGDGAGKSGVRGGGERGNVCVCVCVARNSSATSKSICLAAAQRISGKFREFWNLVLEHVGSVLEV